MDWQNTETQPILLTDLQIAQRQVDYLHGLVQKQMEVNERVYYLPNTIIFYHL